MSDPLKHVSPGDSLAISAKTFNTLIDTANLTRKQRMGPAGARPAQQPPVTPANLAYIKWTTGSLLERSVVKISDPVISAVDNPVTVQRTPVFTAGTPDATDNAFAITIEPTAAGTISKAVVSGVAVVDVNVSDITHQFAAPAAGQTGYLASAASGPARILWKDTGTGIKRAVVLLGVGDGKRTYGKLTTQDVVNGGWKWRPAIAPVAYDTLSQINHFTSFGTESETFNAYQIQQERTLTTGTGAYGQPTGNEIVELIPLGDGTFVFELTYTTAHEWRPASGTLSPINLSNATPDVLIGCIDLPTAGPYRIYYHATASARAVDSLCTIWAYSADGHPLLGGGTCLVSSEPNTDAAGTAYTTPRTAWGSSSKQFVYNAAGPGQIALRAMLMNWNSAGGLGSSALNSGQISPFFGGIVLSADRLDTAEAQNSSCAQGSGSGSPPPPPPPGCSLSLSFWGSDRASTVVGVDTVTTMGHVHLNASEVLLVAVAVMNNGFSGPSSATVSYGGRTFTSLSSELTSDGMAIVTVYACDHPGGATIIDDVVVTATGGSGTDRGLITQALVLADATLVTEAASNSTATGTDPDAYPTIGPGSATVSDCLFALSAIVIASVDAGGMDPGVWTDGFSNVLQRGGVSPFQNYSLCLGRRILSASGVALQTTLGAPLTGGTPGTIDIAKWAGVIATVVGDPS